jgi:hypothetical protein
MASGTVLKKNGFIVKLQQARDGAAKIIPKGTMLTLGGQQMTIEQLVAGFDAELTKVPVVATSKAQWQAAVAAVRSGLPAARELYLALKKWAELNYPKGDPRLAEFGFPIRTPKKPSSATRIVAKIKAAQTRAARHTLGSQQRLAITAPAQPKVVVLGPDGLPLGEKPATAPEAPPAAPPSGPAKG